MNIERMLNEENREKKRIGSNVHNKRGLKGYVGKMLFPTDLMSRKEKYNTRKGGKVEKFNMYEIMTKSEFDQKDAATQKMLLTTWRENQANKDILKGMGISSNTLSKLLIDLEIPKKKRGGARSRTSTPTKIRETDDQSKMTPQIFEASNTLTETKKHENQQTAELFPKSDGLSLEYNGFYTSEQLIKIFTKLQLIVDDETCNFEIAFSLKEGKKNA